MLFSYNIMTRVTTPKKKQQTTDAYISLGVFSIDLIDFYFKLLIIVTHMSGNIIWHMTYLSKQTRF